MKTVVRQRYGTPDNRNGTYVTVGGSLPRLLQVLVLGPLMSRM